MYASGKELLMQTFEPEEGEGRSGKEGRQHCTQLLSLLALFGT
jgi:hypothetical protein